MRILHLTPGTGNFHCGSCLRDHALIKALRVRGHDAMMAPLYLPLVTDRDLNEGPQPVRAGGIALYFQQKLPWFHRLPRIVHRWLSHPALLQLAARGMGMTSARVLGEMTLGSLLGTSGRQWGEWQQLINWAKTEAKPDLVSLSNSLLTGLAPAIRDQLGVPVIVSLQGEDAFLDTLQEPWRSQAWQAMTENAQSVSRFISPSHFYQQNMAPRLGVSPEQITVIPNGLDLTPFPIADPDPNWPSIGYLARMIAGKGLGTLVDAFILLCQRGTVPGVKLNIGGAQTTTDLPYIQELQARLKQVNLDDRVSWQPNLSFQEKLRFLSKLSVFSVPATYGEAFGLYVIEAMASGVPVVQPDHGAFPELLNQTQGGLLCTPDDPISLADQLQVILQDSALRASLARNALHNSRRDFTATAMTERFEEVLQSCHSAHC
jgi:glycosyltransferase involved in cell wall biosynthesis